MSFRYLLDTNICIYIAKQKPISVFNKFEQMKVGSIGMSVSVFNKFEQMKVGSIGMSVITYGELYYGAQKSAHPKKTMGFLDELTSLIPPLPLPTDIAKHYGHIRATLEKQGKTIDNNDLWIASHTLAIGLILVTNNQKEFSRIPKLKIENWVD